MRFLRAYFAEGESAWSRVIAMIATRKQAEYDAAVTLLTDLQELAVRENRLDTFTARTNQAAARV